MAKQKKQPKADKQARPPRVRLSAAESLKRTREFAQRKEQFIASVRKGKDRGLSA
jgi:hypothetical protein